MNRRDFIKGSVAFAVMMAFSNTLTAQPSPRHFEKKELKDTVSHL